MVLLTPAKVPRPRAPRGGEHATRVGRGQLPDGEHDDGSPRPEVSARETHDPEPESEEKADRAGDGLRPAGQGEETNPTKPPRRRRPARGTEGPPRPTRRRRRRRPTMPAQ